MERRKVGTAVEKEGWDWWRGERLGLVEGRKVGTGGGEEGWDWWREGRLGLVEVRNVGTGGDINEDRKGIVISSIPETTGMGLQKIMGRECPYLGLY